VRAGVSRREREADRGPSQKFYSPAYTGPRGWVGLRLDRGTPDWDEVRDLLTASYLQVAPQKLRAQVESALD